MHPRRSIGLLFPPAALLAVFATAAPQPPGQSQPEPPLFRDAVDLVEVVVSVTDADGRRIADLRADEFEILEDGVVQPLLSFT
jgi:hypothetical protein